MQLGLFDWQNRFEKLDKTGDPLAKLNKVVPWHSFRTALETLRARDKKNNAGAKPYDVIVMFTALTMNKIHKNVI